MTVCRFPNSCCSLSLSPRPKIGSWEFSVIQHHDWSRHFIYVATVLSRDRSLVNWFSAVIFSAYRETPRGRYQVSRDVGHIRCKSGPQSSQPGLLDQVGSTALEWFSVLFLLPGPPLSSLSLPSSCLLLFHPSFSSLTLPSPKQRWARCRMRAFGALSPFSVSHFLIRVQLRAQTGLSSSLSYPLLSSAGMASLPPYLASLLYFFSIRIQINLAFELQLGNLRMICML